jgi:hypothetical protein
MKITPVNQRDLNRRAFELLRRVQAPETASQDYHAVLLFHPRHSSEHNLSQPGIISKTVILSSLMSERRK